MHILDDEAEQEKLSEKEMQYAQVGTHHSLYVSLFLHG